MVRHHQNAHLLETEGRDSKVQEEKEGKSSKEKSITVKNLLLCTLKQRGTGHSVVIYVPEHVAMVFSMGLQSVVEGEDSVPTPGCLKS